jgi:hypothetical protein
VKRALAALAAAALAGPGPIWTGRPRSRLHKHVGGRGSHRRLKDVVDKHRARTSAKAWRRHRALSAKRS